MGFTLRRQKSWLEQHRGRERRHQRQSHQLAHARRARMVRKPQAAEGGSGRAGAEEYSPRQARLQEIVLSRSPRHDVVDFERDAHAQQKRQRDDVGEIELEPDRHAHLEGDDYGDQQRHERQRDVLPAPQRHEQDQRDRQERQDGGLKKRFDDRRSRLDDKDRRAARLRSHLANGIDEPMQDGIVVPVSAWPHFDPDLAVGRDPIAFERRRKRVNGHMLGREEIANLAKRRHERRNQHALRLLSGRWRRLRQSIERTRQAARLRGGRSVQIARRRGEVGGRLVDRLQCLSRGRRGVDGIGIERIRKEEVGVVDGGELLVLVLGHEAFERPYVGDFRQRLELFHHRRGAGEIGLQDIDRVGARVRIAHQIEEGRDRLGMF